MLKAVYCIDIKMSADAPTTNDVPDIKELPQFLKRWIAIEEEIASINTTLREKRKQSKAFKETILRIMQGNKVQQINTNKGAVVDRKRKIKEAI